jgi:hypothetical protein
MTEQNEQVVSKNTFRASIIASIIASMFVIAFIQPIMAYIWELISSTGNDFLNLLVDRMYENAALGDKNWVVSTFVIVGVYAPFVLSSTRIFASWTARKLFSSKEQLDEVDKEKKVNSIVFRLRIAQWISTFIGIVCATVIASYIYTDMQVNASFKQRLTVLSPKLSDAEYKEFLAKWASMTSKEDYQAINQKLENQASKVGVKLPRPL